MSDSSNILVKSGKLCYDWQQQHPGDSMDGMSGVTAATCLWQHGKISGVTAATSRWGLYVRSETRYIGWQHGRDVKSYSSTIKLKERKRSHEWQQQHPVYGRKGMSLVTAATSRWQQEKDVISESSNILVTAGKGCHDWQQQHPGDSREGQGVAPFWKSAVAGCSNSQVLSVQCIVPLNSPTM